MADASVPFETRQDGSIVLDPPVELPEVLDAVIVGGGPFGTAAAFRLKELGRSALVIDYDDLMKRIRDYAKGKPILPDYGGGDRMQFPKGGDLVRKLQFPRIDKDEMCVQWKSFYREFNVPAQVGVEMTGLDRDGDIWHVVAWNHNLKKEQIIKAKHVVLAFGRGVPRRFDIPGNVAGLAFALTIAHQYVGEPVLVIGGGTSAAEAVIAISGAKNSAGDPTDVYWSYRGERMPKVSRALADEFFDAFVGNGNVRYLPTSEPVAVLEIGEESFLSVRTNRVVAAGCPPETTQLEFKKTHCIACIGEDIPELLLTNIGVPLVAGGAANKKRIVVSPLLETRQPNVYLAGAVLSPAYFETTEFDDPTTFKEIKRRDNIKAAMRDGVLVAEVIEQKLAGKTLIEVQLEFEEGEAAAAAAEAPALPAEPAPSPPAEAPPPVPTPAPAPSTASSAGTPLPAAPVGEAPPPPPPSVHTPTIEHATVKVPRRTAPAGCRLVSILPSGVEANEFALKVDSPTTIGRHGADVAFSEDLGLSDIHARIIPSPDGYRVRDEGSAEGVFLQPAGGRLLMVEPGAIIRAGRQWLVVGDDPGTPSLIHYDTSGRHVARHDLKTGTTIFGRQSPDVTIAADDGSLSRRHFATVVQDGHVGIKDLGSGNGTYVKVSSDMLLADGDRIHLSRQVLQFTDEKETAEPEAKVSVDTTFYQRQAVVSQAAAIAPAAPAAPKSTPAAEPAKPAAAKPAAQAPPSPPAPAKPAEPPPAPAKPAVSQQSSPSKPAPAAAPAPSAPPPAAAPAPATDGQPAVTFQDLNRHVPCSKGQTLCEVAEAAGIEIEADCHAGVCGMDPIQVFSGGEHLGPLTGKERSTLEDLCSLDPTNHRLACMARVSGPVVVAIIKQ